MAAACGSNAGTPSTPSDTDAQSGYTISVQDECIRLHGQDSNARGRDGQGSTGWFCQLPGGTEVPFTAADMQSACDHQHPGRTRAVQLSTTPPPGGNSVWVCRPTKPVPTP